MVEYVSELSKGERASRYRLPTCEIFRILPSKRARITLLFSGFSKIRYVPVNRPYIPPPTKMPAHFDTRWVFISNGVTV